MGRIFEVRKHTMFARWDKMAKQFSRIGKEIAIAVKAGEIGIFPRSRRFRILFRADGRWLAAIGQQ